MALILSALSALFYGVADFAGGFASSKNRTVTVLVVSQAAGLLLAWIALAVFWPGAPRPRDLLWGVGGGLCGALGLFMLYRGIATSLVAVVSPASALLSALLPLGAGLLLGERPSALAGLGAALCVPAVLLLSWQAPGDKASGKPVGPALLQGSVAGLGFGGFYICLARASADSGLWPAIASRSTSLAIFILSLCWLHLRARRSGSPYPRARGVLGLAKGSLPITLTAGCADMGANVLFLLASRLGLLSIVSIVTSLYPAPTVILGWLAFREKVPKARVAGLILALTGVVLISMK